MSRKIQKILYYSSAFFLTISLLSFVVFYSELIFPYITSKHLFFRESVALAFALYLPLFLIKKYRPDKSIFLFLIPAFFLSFLFADIFAVYPQLAFWGGAERMEGFISFFYFILFFILLSSFFKDEKFRTFFIRFYLFVSSAIIIYSINVYFSELEKHPGTVFRLNAVFNNAIYLAQFALFHIALSALRFVKSNIYIEKLLMALTVPMAFFVIVKTASRGVLLALFLSALMAGAFYVWKGGGRYVKYAFALFIVIFLSLSIALFANRDSDFVNKSYALKRLSSVSLDHKSTIYSRLTVWKIALDSILGPRLLTGFGQNGFNYIFYTNYDPSLWAHESNFDRAHNTAIDVLTQGGILSFVIYLSILFLTLRAILRLKRSNFEKSVLLFIFLSYFLASLSIFDSLTSYVPILIFYAYLHSIVSLSKSNDVSYKLKQDDANEDDLRQRTLVLLSGLALVFVIFVSQSVYIDFRAAKSTADLLQLVSYKNIYQRLSAVPDNTLKPEYKKLKIKVGNLFKDLSENLSDRWRTASVSKTLEPELLSALFSPDFAYAVMQNEYVKDDDKQEYLSYTYSSLENLKASKYPNFTLLVRGAMWLATVGHKDEAEKLLLELLEHAPQKVQIREYLVKFYIKQKEFGKAQKELSKLINLAPDNERANLLKDELNKELDMSKMNK